MFFTPPSPAALERLAEELDFKRQQMADLAGVSTGRQWAKYTWTEKTPEKDRRPMSFSMLFLIAARLLLMKGPIKNIEQVYAEMRRIGAEVDPDRPADSPARDGEQQA